MESHVGTPILVKTVRRKRLKKRNIFYKIKVPRSGLKTKAYKEAKFNIIQRIKANKANERKWYFCKKGLSHISFQCVRLAGLEPDTVDRCVMTGEGIALQLDSEYQTNSLAPQFIPSITIDGVGYINLLFLFL